MFYCHYYIVVCACKYYKYLQLVKSLILAFVQFFIVYFEVLRCTHEYISKVLSTYLSILQNVYSVLTQDSVLTQVLSKVSVLSTYSSTFF